MTYSARGLYIHIPFCQSKCAYCDFASWRTADKDLQMRDYVIAIQHQVEHMRWLGLLDECETCYIGGGTPSYLGKWLWWLCQTVHNNCELEEFSCEANPESVTDELLDLLAQEKVSRMSVGVQSFIPKELKALGRVHSSAKAKEAILAIKNKGFDVSCDLMCGIPYQTKDTWQKSLSVACGLGVDHISCYPLQIEDHTGFGRAVQSGKMHMPDPDFQADCMLEARNILQHANFSQYEVASYSKPGHECAHNISYWSAKPYLGLGCGASSMLTAKAYKRLQKAIPKLCDIDSSISRIRMKNTSTPIQVAQSLSIDQMSFECEFLTLRQALAEDMMLASRMRSGINPALIDMAEQCMGHDLVQGRIKYLIDMGLCYENEVDYICPTDKGWLLGNELYGQLWDLSEGEIQTARC